MRKIKIIGLFLAVSIPFCYVIYDMISGNIAEAPSSYESESTPSLPSTESLNTYSNELIAFDYPYGYTAEEGVSETMVTLTASKSNAFPIKFYLASTSVKTFEEFVAIIKTDFESHVVAVPGFSENEEHTYSFETEINNDIPVLIHKRNFESMTGAHQEAYLWLGNETIITVSTEDSDIFENIIKSVRRP